MSTNTENTEIAEDTINIYSQNTKVKMKLKVLPYLFIKNIDEFPQFIIT